MIAYCGIDCSKCGAFLATAANDDALRAKTSAEWSKAYGVEIPPAAINCTGCRSTGVKFSYCESGCEIRKCSSKSGLDTCADCPDYACDKLKSFHEMAPEPKQTLDALRAKKTK
ncbi:MAG TPA: DUF3795 domain-containing protein [bacterium]|nr:DUF3795 domain-containing protein [bacterium]